jgi:hypothetical protein
MNTTKIPNNEAPNRFSELFLITKPVKRLLAASFGTLLAVCATLSARAQLVYSVNLVGCVPERTTYLLTAPLTIQQRQVVHAENFNQLAPAARAPYLRAVAYAVGIMVGSGGQPPSSAALAEYLQSASPTRVDVVACPELLAHKAIVKEAMKELNVLIAVQVAGNPAYLQAIEAGAVDSIFDEIEDFE